MGNSRGKVVKAFAADSDEEEDSDEVRDVCCCCRQAYPISEEPAGNTRREAKIKNDAWVGNIR